MLIELGVVEQRHKAVLEVMGGLPVTEVAGRYGVTRQTVHRWLRWYAQGGIAALADSSCRPATCPHRMSPEVEARIVALRTEHPSWGPRTLLHYLAREELFPLPGRSSVHRCLTRHRLIEPQKRRRKREDYRRWERLRAMELWQMDVMGGVRLTSGGELKVVTGIDDHSRFCVCAHLTPRATARPVCEAFLAAMRRHGAPEQVLTDNGKVFTARFGRGTGLVLFDRICHENGIRHLLTAPRSPTTTGKVERFHKTGQKLPPYSKLVAMYQYDRSEPLDMRVLGSVEKSGVEMQSLNYNHDGLPLYAWLVTPAGEGPFPVIVYTPGTGTPVDMWAPEAAAMALEGFAGLLVEESGAPTGPTPCPAPQRPTWTTPSTCVALSTSCRRCPRSTPSASAS